MAAPCLQPQHPRTSAAACSCNHIAAQLEPCSLMSVPGAICQLSALQHLTRCCCRVVGNVNSQHHEVVLSIKSALDPCKDGKVAKGVLCKPQKASTVLSFHSHAASAGQQGVWARPSSALACRRSEHACWNDGRECWSVHHARHHQAIRDSRPICSCLVHALLLPQWGTLSAVGADLAAPLRLPAPSTATAGHLFGTAWGSWCRGFCFSKDCSSPGHTLLSAWHTFCLPRSPAASTVRHYMVCCSLQNANLASGERPACSSSRSPA